MTRHSAAALLLAATAGLAAAQTPAPPAGPPPTGIVVGSGNFFSPIVADLDNAIAFYRDGLGLDVTGAPANADANPPLRNMFGVPDAQLRWTVARPAAMRAGVEIVEIGRIARKPLVRRIHDPGAFTLIATVRDVDAVAARLLKLGGTVVTRSGMPIPVPMRAGTARAVTIAAPDGHFVELLQPDPLPATAAPATAAVVDVRVRLTVDDVDRALRLYRDVLGLKQLTLGAFGNDTRVLDMLGVQNAQYRLASAQVPTTGLTVEFIEYKGTDRRTVQGDIQDPGSTRIQLQVRDVDEASRALRAAGGAVVSTGGSPVELAGRGGATTKAAIVRDPNNLFLVLIQAPRPAN